MLDEVLIFLRDRLNSHLLMGDASTSVEPHEGTVVFLDGEKMDPIAFKPGAVTVLLINVEEENTLRQPNPYRSVNAGGDTIAVNPEIRMNLLILFVARYKQYEAGLAKLSEIIGFFQSHRVFNHQNAPELSANIEKLMVELITLPLAEQNDLWSALRTTYHPSVLYKLGLVVFRDPEARRPAEIGEKATRVSP